MDLYDFFYQELSTVKARTGMLQWDKLNESSTKIEDINQLIDFMIIEIKKPPFDKVNVEVKQRVISRAIVEDKDFIGLNAKFVRKALSTWWEVNGDRVLMAVNYNNHERVELTPEQNAKVNTLLKSYSDRLLSEASNIKLLPRMKSEVAKKEGAEWTSNIERKASKYVNNITPEGYELKKQVQLEAGKFYRNLHEFSKMKQFSIEGIDFLALSEEDAYKIYRKAKRKL